MYRHNKTLYNSGVDIYRCHLIYLGVNNIPIDRRLAMEVLGGVSPKLAKLSEAVEWFSGVLSERTGLPEQVVGKLFAKKINDISEIIVYDSYSFNYGYLWLREVIDVVFPVIPESLFPTIAKYIKGEVDESMYEQYKGSVEENYNGFIGKYPVVESVVFGNKIDSFVNNLISKSNPMNEKAKLYFKYYLINSFLDSWLLPNSLVFFNYLTLATKSINSSVYPFPDFPVLYPFSSILVASVILWLVDAKEYRKCFGVYCPFEFEDMDNFVEAYKRFTSMTIGFDNGSSEATPVDVALRTILTQIKANNTKFFSRFLDSFRDLVVVAMCLGVNVWSRPITSDNLVEGMKVKGDKIFKKTMTPLYLANFWNRVFRFVNKYLNVKAGSMELDLVGKVINAVKNNRKANIDTAVKRYVRSKMTGKDEAERVNFAGRKGVVGKYIKSKSLGQVLEEIEHNKRHLTEYNSLECLFGLSADESMINLIEKGYIPSEWKSKTLSDIIEVVFNSSIDRNVLDGLKLQFKNSQQTPLSFRNVSDIIYQMMAFYRIYGKDRFLDKLERFFDVLYPAGYPYRGLRIWTFMLPILMFLVHPEMIIKVKCVGRKYGSKIVSLTKDIFSI